MNTEKKINIKMTVPFFRVKDMEASLRFYVDGLGFSITNKWTPRGKIEWCWLTRDAVALMIQEPNRESGNHKGSEETKGTGVSISFQCEDALALYHEFRDRGLAVKNPLVGNNMWVVVIIDPDGYHLEFESMTDTPEETEYSESLK